MTITVNHFLIVSFLLFSIGFFGVLTRRNFLTVLMSIELDLNR
jgi:NADH:ubiquinone oxidoreductase subunit K